MVLESFNCGVWRGNKQQTHLHSRFQRDQKTNEGQVFKSRVMITRIPSEGSFCCGSVKMNLTSIHEDVGLIPGPTQWVKDMALL